VTSAAWSDTFGVSVGLAYLWHPDRGPVTTEHVTSGTYAVDVGGEIHLADVGLRAPFDPSNERVRS
jgi:glycine cleavage system aminomethyltransferase T